MQIRFWNVLGITISFYKYDIPLELVKDSICDKFYFLYFLVTKKKKKIKKVKYIKIENAVINIRRKR